MSRGREGGDRGRAWPRNALSLLGQCQLMSPACNTGWSCQPETGDHSKFAFILESSVSRAWGEEGGYCGQLNEMGRGGGYIPVLPGAQEVAGGLGLPGQEQWHRRFSGHKAGPDSLPLHPPCLLPTSAGSWLCPVGLGERSEACASKGLGKAETLL